MSAEKEEDNSTIEAKGIIGTEQIMEDTSVKDRYRYLEIFNYYGKIRERSCQVEVDRFTSIKKYIQIETICKSIIGGK